MPAKRSATATPKEKKTEVTGPIKKKQKSDGTDVVADSTNGDVEWTQDLTEALIAAITDNPQIKQGLFPSPGANVSTAKGGGKSKTEFHRQLAVILFRDHPDYKTAFSLAKTVKQMAPWAVKIKNRLRKMSQITAAFLAELGQTGAGIRHEDVDRERNPELANKWDQIDQECPWFDDMRELMGERPNAIPVGIGNSSTDVDISTVLPELHGIGTPELVESDIDDDQSTSQIKDEEIDTPSITLKKDSDESSDDESAMLPSKRKTPTRAISKAAAMPKAAKKTKIAEFADAAKAEEKTLQQHEVTLQQRQVTKQKQLALAMAKIERDKARVEYKTEKLRIKLELEKLKAQRAQAHDITSSHSASSMISSRESSIAAGTQTQGMLSLLGEGNIFDDMFVGGVDEQLGQPSNFLGVGLGTGAIEGGINDGLDHVEGI